ncbi:unnamed protein product [Rangifer tarandus platyrhynchus]|uniref:Uncharacterized protein n=1 Tax=Rangifer tarandus platyrhynchus TaxID=3082113 RepID=A0AC59YSU2_RANTA
MLLLPLMLLLLWVGEQGRGSTDTHLAAGSLAQDPKYRLEVQPSVSVQEGLCVHVSCSVSYPQEDWGDSDPAHGYWFWERADSPEDPPVATNNLERAVASETRGRFLLVGDPRAYNCSLDIRDAQRRDTGTYIFRLERGPTVRYSYALNLLSVHVKDAPQELTIRVYQKEGAGPETLDKSQSLSVQEGQFLRLDCVPDSNPPAMISWTRGSLTLSPSNSSNPGVLELPRVELRDHGLYVCRAQHPLGSKEASLSFVVRRSPGPRTGVVWGAVGGAGVTSLLALCLIFPLERAKIYRKKSAARAPSQDGDRPASSPASRGHFSKSWSDSPLDHQTPFLAASTSEKEQELHYASLSFHRPGTHNFQVQDTTEYSEIKIGK